MNVEFLGPAGRIEALIRVPAAEPRAVVVLAHPHPRYGGTMLSRVVHEAARGFAQAGAAAVRFNFRGVGRSAGVFDDGVGEAADFVAVLEAAAQRYAGLPIWAAGYSFGAWIATSVGAVDQRVSALIAIAPPLGEYDFAAARACRKPKFLIQAERDQLCPLKTMHRFYAEAEEPRDLVVIDGADHAFDGKASEVGDAIADLLMDFREP